MEQGIILHVIEDKEQLPERLDESRHAESFKTDDRRALLEKIESHLSEADAALLRNNFKGIERDPLLVAAAVAAIAHLRDKVPWSIILTSCVPELLAIFGAQIAAAVSGDYARLDVYRQALANKRYAFNNGGLVGLVTHAMALGFQERRLDTAVEEVSHAD
jgi:hypothetical protein